MSSFGKALENFAKSVDVVDREICKNFYRYLKTFLRNSFKENFFYEIQLDGAIIDGKPALAPFKLEEEHWTNGSLNSSLILNSNGKYNGQTAYAYDTKRDLWITAQKVFLEGNNGVDHWSNAKDLPEYVNFFEKQIRTSIIMPLKYGKRCFGFFNIETPHFMNYSEIAAKELKSISNAIAIVIWLYQTNSEQVSNSLEALERTTDIEMTLNFTPPILFFAFSKKSDMEIVGLINTVLNEYEEKEVFVVKRWNEFHESGDANQQIMNVICSSKYGICYLSEKATFENSPEYLDNPNVIFEAGLLHFKSQTAGGAYTSWIPIREENSPTLQFDLVTQRILIVSRNSQTKTPNKELFQSELKNRLNQMLMTIK